MYVDTPDKVLKTIEHYQNRTSKSLRTGGYALPLLSSLAATASLIVAATDNQYKFEFAVLIVIVLAAIAFITYISGIIISRYYISINERMEGILSAIYFEDLNKKKPKK